KKQMEAIQRELGDGEAGGSGDLRHKLEGLALHDEARAEAMRELERLERTPEISPEHGMIRTYLDWSANMPWNKLTGARIDVERARTVLDRDHYDLEKVKDRILDYLAVKLLREERKADVRDVRTEPILCFLGPPGVGKTSLGQSIARALGRSFV